MKITVVGTHESGKSSLLLRYLSPRGRIAEVKPGALSTALLQRYGAYLLDTSNSQMDRGVLHTKVLVADCIIAVFDVSRPETFRSEMAALLQEISLLISSKHKPTPVIMVGNKVDMLSLVGDTSVSPSVVQEIQTSLQNFPFLCGCMLTTAMHPAGLDGCTPISTIFQLAMFYARLPPQLLYDRALGIPTAATKEAALHVYWRLDSNRQHELDHHALDLIEKICFAQQGNDSFVRKQLQLLSGPGGMRGRLTVKDFLHFVESLLASYAYAPVWALFSHFGYDCGPDGKFFKTDLPHNLSLIGAIEHAAYVFQSFMALHSDLIARKEGERDSRSMPLELVIELVSHCDPTIQQAYCQAWRSLLQAHDTVSPLATCLHVDAIGADDEDSNEEGEGECGGCRWSCAIRLSDEHRLEHGCSLEAWLDFWRLLSATIGVKDTVQMLHRVGFRPDGDTKGGTSDTVLVPAKDIVVPHLASYAWTLPRRICVIDCSKSGAMRYHLFPYGAGSDFVTTAAKIHRSFDERGNAGPVDASLEDGCVEEAIVTAFNRSLSSRVFESSLSKSFKLCIVLADPTEDEEISLLNLPPELPVVLAPSSVFEGVPSIGKLVAAGIAAVNHDPRGGLSPAVCVRLWAVSVVGRAWDLSLGPLFKVIAHPWGFFVALWRGKAREYLFKFRPLFKPGWR